MQNLNYGVIGNCRSAALISEEEVSSGAVCLILILLQFFQNSLIMKKEGPSVSLLNPIITLPKSISLDKCIMYYF